MFDDTKEVITETVNQRTQQCSDQEEDKTTNNGLKHIAKTIKD
jgi:hypothetical protein